ncbi:MAG: D-alanine--D-alanine ligase family protein, partial [Gemmatimonadaceae bacterium]
MTRIGFAFNQKPDPAAEAFSRGGAGASSSSVGSSGGDTVPAGADQFAEWDSPETIAAVENALSPYGEVIRLEATEDFPERLRAARPDIVFNIAEGLNGRNRESHVPAICEFLGVPYTGSDPFTLTLCLDKARAKEALAFNQVPTPRFVVIRTAAQITKALDRLTYPVFVKPVHEGSSKGITEANYCRTPTDLMARISELLEEYDQPVIAEEFLPGAEFTCGILGNGSKARVLPLVAINFGALPENAVPIYGFEAKWIWDVPENPLQIFECPAKIDAPLQRSIERVTLDAYHVTGCRDWARIDVRLDSAGVPNVIEVNPLPGILPNPEENSCLPNAARAAGIGYDELIQACLLAGAKRYGL